MNRFLTGVIIAVLFLSIVFHANAAPLDEVKKLPVDVIEGEITVYHTKGYEDRALMLGQMLEESNEFLEQLLGISASINLAVLDRSHWLQVTKQFPYGLPCVFWGKDYVVLLPATIDDGAVVSMFLDMSGKVSQSVLDRLESHNLTYDDAARMMVDVIGFHELGHIYTQVYELTTHRKWFDEIVATYFAYAYMDARHPEFLAVYEALCQTIIDTVDPRFTSFEDFETIYTGVGTENLGWYQSMFVKRISAIYPEHGLSFLEKGKASLESDRKLTDEELLARLEDIAPGFIQWAEEVENYQFSAVSPQDKLPVTWGNINRGR